MTASRRLLRGVILAATLCAWTSASASPTIIGALNNFDVYNETGEVEHGFEIEIHGVDSSDISYTYRNPRYGTPRQETIPGGVRVRYESAWDGDRFVTRSEMGLREHFGVTLRRSATSIEYNWLSADPGRSGTLVRFGTPVSLPQPTFSVDTSGPTPVVRSELVNGAPGADAVWVKRYARPFNREVQLDELMTDDPVVMETPELNGEFELVDGGASLLDDDPVSAEEAASILVIEVYRYTGAYDDSHTPSCPGQCEGTRGALIATMMTAANLGAAQADLSVSTAGNGSGTVTSTPAGIDCGTTCTAAFDSGTQVTLTATPADGSFFGGWAGACTDGDAVAALALSQASNCTAVFHLLSQSADLSVSARQLRAKARAGRRVFYRITVRNLGPASASAGVLTSTITGLAPADVGSIRASRGCVVSAGTVTCPLGDVRNRRVVAKRISVKPSASGTMGVSSQATSATPDPVSANQTAEVITLVQ